MGSIANKIFDAEQIVVSGLREKEIETEPSLTDRFLGAVKMTFHDNGFVTQGYRIRVRTLRDRGNNAPEHEFGPDFVSILDINIPNYSLSKGFLVQAKLAGKEEFQIIGKGNYPVQIRLPAKGKSRLVTQCEQMLNITPDSFIFVYSEIGIYVVPAITIVSIASNGTPEKTHAKTLKQFYRDHIMSFIGDKKINAFDDHMLRLQRDTTSANSAMLLQMREEADERSRFSLVEI